MILNHAQEWGLKCLAEAQVAHIIGIDEVGLGACAGPLVVCGAVFPKDWKHEAVKDSKKYSGGGIVAHEKRLKVREHHIYPSALHVELEVVTHKDIDFMGLGAAVTDAMRRVGIRCTHRYPDGAVAIDGEYKPYLRRAQLVVALPKGDGLVPAISAASVIAKTTRDSTMILSHALYPDYGFDEHMGYWTEKHKAAVVAKGPCPIHRLSYKNIQEIVVQRHRGSL
jgi:ribonuclease HII